MKFCVVFVVVIIQRAIPVKYECTSTEITKPNYIQPLQYTRDIQLFAARIVFIICIVEIIYITTFIPLKSDQLGHIYLKVLIFIKKRILSRKIKQFFEKKKAKIRRQTCLVRNN